MSWRGGAYSKQRGCCDVFKKPSEFRAHISYLERVEVEKESEDLV